MCGRPLSFTGISVDSVPSVWPGVWYSVSVVSPSVSFWPSVADHVAARPVRVLLSSRSQSAAAENHARVEAILQVLRAAGMIGVTVADDDVLDCRRIQPQLLIPPTTSSSTE